MARISLDKIDGIYQTFTSKNGFPIFDFMQRITVTKTIYQTLGHMETSGTGFYTEDDALVSQLKTVLGEKKLDERIAFIKQHPECIVEVNTIPALERKAAKAYNNLLDTKSREHTMAAGNYGAAWLVEKKDILVFWQNDPEIDSFYTSNYGRGTFVNLNKTDELQLAQRKLRALWREGKIQPEAVINGGAATKLRTALSDDSLNNNHTLDKLINKIQEFGLFSETRTTVKTPDQDTLLIMFGEAENIKITLAPGSQKDYVISDKDNNAFSASREIDVLATLQHISANVLIYDWQKKQSKYSR